MYSRANQQSQSLGGGVKMAVWEDADLASPHN